MVTHVTNTRTYQKHRFNDIWGDLHVSLPYINEPFNDPVTQKRWLDQGFTHQKFTGDLYDMRFPEPGWITKFRQQLPLAHFSWSVYRMLPGTVLPEHGDTYRRFCEIYSIIDIKRIIRYVVFLEDWNSGHYFEIDNQPVVFWSKGDAISWRGSTPHLAANIGKAARYTLQITGLTDD